VGGRVRAGRTVLAFVRWLRRPLPQSGRCQRRTGRANGRSPSGLAETTQHSQRLTTKCEAAPLMAAFTQFTETGRLAPNLVKFLGDAASNKTEPYKAR